MQPASLVVDLDILFVGSCRSITRAPSAGVTAFGNTKVSPNRWLKRIAISRVISMCCFWSSPTGTSSASYNKMSAAWSAGYVKRPAETNSASRFCDLSLNCVIRDNSPYETVHSIIQERVVCSTTWLCTKTVATSGSRPTAKSIAASSSVFWPSTPGDSVTVKAWRSTIP